MTHRRRRPRAPRPVVEAPVGGELVEAGDRAGLGVGRAEHQLCHPRVHERTRAHRARLEGDHQHATVETPAAAHGRRVAQREDLGVCRGIARAARARCAGARSLRRCRCERPPRRSARRDGQAQRRLPRARASSARRCRRSWTRVLVRRASCAEIRLSTRRKAVSHRQAEGEAEVLQLPDVDLELGRLTVERRREVGCAVAGRASIVCSTSRVQAPWLLWASRRSRRTSMPSTSAAVSSAEAAS